MVDVRLKFSEEFSGGRIKVGGWSGREEVAFLRLVGSVDFFWREVEGVYFVGSGE